MQASYLTEYGPPELLGYGEPPDPQLADAAEAHRRVAARDFLGKIALVPERP